MTKQTVSFERSIDEKVVVSATAREGWVTGLFVGADSALQYNITTTEASGKPSQIWCRDTDLSDVV